MCSALSAMNCDIITGGGPGLMQAANEGARAAQASQGVQSIGIRVHLPFEQEVNPFVEQAFEHATFFTRLHHFVLLRCLHRCHGWPRNPARNDDDLAALADASPARHSAHFRRSHLEGLGRMGKPGDAASRIRAGEPAGHADTVLRGHRRGSSCHYPGSPRTLAERAGQELLSCGPANRAVTEFLAKWRSNVWATRKMLS